MTEKVDEHVNTFCEQLKRQFLCCYPVRNIDWLAVPKTLAWEQQQQLIDSTYGHQLNQEYPVKLSYQLNFLKRLLHELERHYVEVHDAAYGSYCAVQQRVAQDATQKYAYKHYLLPHDRYSATFTLRESKSFVAEGTTGLCSWQASLALADYLLHNKEIVCHKNVLELGAGTGLCGLILIRCCGAKEVLLTDGAAECVELMRENIVRNFKEAAETTSGSFEVGTQTLCVQQLSWEAIETTTVVNNIATDVLLAADVVYDDSVFPELTHAIDFIFQARQNRCKMLLAATVRNEHTLKKFLELLASLQFSIEEQAGVPLAESQLFWDRSTPVKILLITKGT